MNSRLDLYSYFFGQIISKNEHYFSNLTFCKIPFHFLTNIRDIPYLLPSKPVTILKNQIFLYNFSSYLTCAERCHLKNFIPGVAGLLLY
jgi:hypothetical protein